LHAGSVVAALASWLDARAHRGRWLVRIEDVDVPRTVPGAVDTILRQLSELGLLPDDTPVFQSNRSALYEQALQQLRDRALAYPCTCSRTQILSLLQSRGRRPDRHGDLVYPGTCRPPAGAGRTQSIPISCSWRFSVHDFKEKSEISDIEKDFIAIERELKNSSFDPDHWSDRRLGSFKHDTVHEVGDFVLKRADGCYTYQLAVVVDDAAQGVTDVVRGADLVDNTGRQIALQRALGLPTPRYLHTPLVLAADGQKLSKQNGATPVDTSRPLAALRAAAQVLGLQAHGELASWVNEWASMHMSPRSGFVQFAW
jgi:glutamyl-Q tRNA(Asp) synthetase